MSRRIFVLSEKKEKLILPKEYDLIHVVSGDETTEMSFQRYLREGGNFIESDIFCSFMHTTPIDFRIDYPIIPYTSLAMISTKKELKEDIASLERRKEEDYNIFSGERVETEDDDVREAIEKYMNELKKLTYAFIDAGYYPRGIPDTEQDKVEDWMVTFEDPLQKLFVVSVRPEVSAPDLTVEDEFLINGEFRSGITEYWMAVLANFIVKNEITSIEEISSIGKWSDMDVWNEIRDMEIKL